MRRYSLVALAAIAAFVIILGMHPAPAQDYPNAPVRVFSGFPAGTTADISARVVGAKMGQILGQQFVVENRPRRRVEHRRRARSRARRRTATRSTSARPPT